MCAAKHSAGEYLFMTNSLGDDRERDLVVLTV